MFALPLKNQLRHKTLDQHYCLAVLTIFIFFARFFFEITAEKE